MSPQLPRRSLLTGAMIAVATACTDSSPQTGPRPVPPTQEATIFDLSFEIAHRTRPFALVAPGFAAVDESSGQVGGPRRAESGPQAPFAAVEIAVAELGEASLVAGLATTDDEHVLAVYDPERSRVTIEVRRGGRTHVLRRKKVTLEGPFSFAFAVCENQVTVLVDEGDGWRPVLTERTKVARHVDLRMEEELPRYAYCWGSRGGSAQLRSVRAGLFGMTGVRDPHLVQDADGTAYVRDGRVFLTATCAGLGFFQQAHWGVFSLDLDDPTDLRQEAQVFTRRDGLLLGDHAGQVVRDGGHWIVATSSWGDFAAGSIHVRHTTTTQDVLTGVHLLDTEPTPLPTQLGTWDPAITRADGRWHVAFVESPSQDPFDFHPALAATAASAWTDDLTLVGSADDLHQCEGPILAEAGGRLWLLASDRNSRCYPVFDLDMRRVGRLDAPYPTNIPHPQLVEHPDGGWLLITFDGTPFASKVMGYGTHGDLVVMRSA